MTQDIADKGFEALVGNSKLKSDLMSQIKTGRLSHAYLIEGPCGTGKKTLSAILAKALVCRGENPPCCECRGCLKADKGIHPDIINIAAPEDKDIIPVDSIRELKTDILVLPNEADKRVFIIHEADKMNTSAQNALLKMLEEPPVHAVFILITENSKLLLQTILSRVVKLTMSPLSASEVENYLETHVKASKEQIENAAVHSCGNIGKALELLKSKSSDKNTKLTLEFLRLLSSKSENEFIMLSSKTGNNKDEIISFFDGLYNILRDIEVYKQNSGLSHLTDESILNIAKGFTAKQIIDIMTIVSDTKYVFEKHNANKSISIMSMLSKCWEVIH